MVQVKELPAQGRVLRKPQHPFYLKQRAFAIQPFLLAPVLPGETMENLLIQSRIITDPIVNPIIGWWAEYYFFYVKHRDLDERDEFEQLALDPDWTAGNVDTTGNVVETYHKGATNAIDWGTLCLKRVVAEYFRDEGVAWDAVKIGNLPVASTDDKHTFESIIPAADMPDDPLVNESGSGTLTEIELDAAQRMWEFQRANQLTNQTYEEFLQTYGVRPSTAELHRPELIRYIRDWQYPSNTVNPSTGAPTSAVSWSVAESASKARFFREPGFIFGVSVIRPKTYIAKQKGATASYLNNAFAWLPAIMKDDPYTSLRQFADEAGPLSGTTDANGYWIDLRDLYLYGEQFTNFAPTAGSENVLDLPDAALGGSMWLPRDAMSKSFFVDAAGTAFNIRQDGIVHLTIAGRQVDNT